MVPLSHPLQYLLVALAGWINQQQRDAIAYLQQETVPTDLENAIRANQDASRNWVSYSASRRKGVPYRLPGARRARYPGTVPSGNH